MQVHIACRAVLALPCAASNCHKPVCFLFRLSGCYNNVLKMDIHGGRRQSSVMESTCVCRLPLLLYPPFHLQHFLKKSASDASVLRVSCCSYHASLALPCRALRCAASNCHKALLSLSSVWMHATNNVWKMEIHGSLACWNQAASLQAPLLLFSPCHLQYFLKKSASDASVLRVWCCSFRACAAFQLSPPLLLNPTSLFQDGNPWMTMSV